MAKNQIQHKRGDTFEYSGPVTITGVTTMAGATVEWDDVDRTAVLTARQTLPNL